MLDEVLGRPGSMGSDGLKWWIGRVAPRSAWAGAALLTNDKDVGKEANNPEIDVYYNRVKVRVVGYHDQIGDPVDLPWAHVLASPMLPSGYGYKDHTHYLEGGESVFGFWLDGEDEQKPVIMGVFYRHKRADDNTPPLKGSAPNPVTKNTAETTETGETVGRELGTGDPIKGQSYITNRKFNFITGEITGDKVTRFPVTNEDTTGKGVSTASDSHHLFLKRKTKRPSCRRDDSISQITGLLGDFSEILLTVQQYANFYVNGTINAIIDLEGEIDLIAKQIAGIITGLFNGVRDQIYILVGDKIQQFINSLIPEEIKPIFGQSIKGIMDTIYCIFENLIMALLKTIADFLAELIGKLINAPICAAEQFVGALLSKLVNDMKSAISPILQSLTDTLGGALGTVNDIINQALEIIGLIYSFIGCDELKCPLPSAWDNSYGPTQGERDSAKRVFDSVSILNIPTAFDENGNPKQNVGGFLDEAVNNVNSVFGTPTDEQRQTADYIAGLVGGCSDSKILRCGPPRVEIFGGDGVGGFANAVINNLGQIIGVDILDRGFGYSPEKPPYVTFRDNCGDGRGATGRAVIDPRPANLGGGGISRIIIEYSGYNYRNSFGDVKTIYGTIPGDANTQTANDDNKTVTGQLDIVEVVNTGSGYNDGDKINIEITPNPGGSRPGGLASATALIIGGRVVDIIIENPGTGFTTIPEMTINSETGVGAVLNPVLKFTEVNNESLPEVPAGETVVVVNCIGK